MSASASIVVLTTGGRDAELSELVRSIGDVSAERLLIVNGDEKVKVPDEMELNSWQVHRTGANLGIPRGRNIGATIAAGDIVFFLDDDATVRTPDLVGRTVEMFDENQSLGAVGFRLVVRGTGRSLRRWSPRIGGRTPEVSGQVTSFPGGACAVRRSAWQAVDGLCGEFFYALEETDFAWRLLDAGWDVTYEADLVMDHPDTLTTRHSAAIRQTARNRVWLARRNLPAPLAAAYVLVWAAYSSASDRSIAGFKALVEGSREGLASLPGERNPIRWATVWNMTRRGRPPIF